MQDRYAGDIGDFSKLGLLRRLRNKGFSIGINWYAVPNEDHNDDGKHTKYLNSDDFKVCDEHLWQKLGQIIASKERRISLLTVDDILETTHFTERLDFSGMDRSERDSFRHDWHQKALSQLTGADIVFVDPDNGLIVDSAMGTKRENKYVFPEELCDYYNNGSSVIYYQHKGRKHDDFYLKRCEQLIREGQFDGASGIIMKFRSTSQRYYCFIIHQEHYSAIKEAMDEMIATAWGNHFSLIYPSSN